MNKPILILQMQRMGDLVLTFPLLLWLTRLHPGRELWVVGEESFFKGMHQIGPKAVYFDWSMAHRLKTREYALIVNLSHRPEAAALAGSLTSEAVIGPYDDGGVRRIKGNWQLYRAALIGCNRHNRYHWAELNALDCVPLREIAATTFDPPRRLTPDQRKVGLFVGASEAAKRPSPQFVGELARECLKRDLRPIIFGGPGEKELAAEAAKLAGANVLNLAGKLSLPEFVTVGQTLALFATPDTGPMHLASWTGLATLNLSLGNVNPWETGPYSRGHHVLRAAASCRGCWHCTQPSFICHEHFTPRRTALLMDRLVSKGSPAGLRLPGLRLLTTGQSPLGLYDLAPFTPRSSAREAAGRFWQAFFGWRFGLFGENAAREAARTMRELEPRMAKILARGLPPFVRALAKGLTGAMPDGFWRETPIFFRLLASYLELALANEDHSPASKRAALDTAEACLTLFSV